MVNAPSSILRWHNFQSTLACARIVAVNSVNGFSSISQTARWYTVCIYVVTFRSIIRGTSTAPTTEGSVSLAGDDIRRARKSNLYRTYRESPPHVALHSKCNKICSSKMIERVTFHECRLSEWHLTECQFAEWLFFSNTFSLNDPFPQKVTSCLKKRPI